MCEGIYMRLRRREIGCGRRGVLGLMVFPVLCRMWRGYLGI